MDEDRLARLYSQYAPLIHARARRLLPEEADDVVQEVFMRFINRPPKGSALSSWMYTTSTNICLDRLRFFQRRQRDWRARVREHFSQTGGRGLDELLADGDLCRLLLAGVDRKTRQVVVLRYFDELDQGEIAEVLGVSRKTVGKRLRKFIEQSRRVVRRW